jgi:hypothetical protein
MSMDQPQESRRLKHIEISDEFDRLHEDVLTLRCFVDALYSGGSLNDSLAETNKKGLPSFKDVFNSLPERIVATREILGQEISRLRELLL